MEIEFSLLSHIFKGMILEQSEVVSQFCGDSVPIITET